MQDQTETSEGETLAFSETLDVRSFLGLSLKNGLLNLITLTLYRFWGRTEVRRRVWSHVKLNGEAFEYTGKGRELFIGFLIALFTVGLPFLVIVGGAQFLGPMYALLIILPLYLGLPVLVGAAIFLAFRYMASRTVWRGVRFHLRGSPWDYGLANLGYGLLVGLTLGWFQPAASMRLAEKMWGGLSFGSLNLRWVPRASDGIYGPFAIGWIGFVIGYFVFIGAYMGLIMTSGLLPTPAEGGEAPAQPTFVFMLVTYAAFFVFALYMLLVFAPYQAALLRAIIGSLKIGDARFELKLKTLDLLGLTVSNIILVVVSLGFLSPFVQARTARFMIRRLSAVGTAPLADARQARKGPGSGEGLADAFGFSPI
ncbi:YjgN family protein [Phenylobacterium sp.]|uniref:YjgN family protein n=1 Tax=Phenylobacterium sp. TaxID=1871053 RepID=UPI0027316A1D|nr:YjgN family protein [Phenylobacterium sp.]MDP1875141.1 YjgN family protein [Phenylobacterium sp.]